MGTKVFIVDDDREFLGELEDTLAHAGYEVAGSAGGEDTVAAILAAKPEVILLDLKMAKRSGFQIASTLRQFPQLQCVPLIAMTGFYSNPLHLQIMRACGIQHRILKPFNPLDVISTIESALGENRDKASSASQSAGPSANR